MIPVKEPSAQIRSTAGLQKTIEAAIISSDCPSRVMQVAEEIKELARRLANGEANDIAPSQVCEAAELPEGSKWSEALRPFEEQIDTSERLYNQVDGLIRALLHQEDLYAPFAALEGAAFDLVATDCPQHNVPVEELLPAAVARAKERAGFTASWYWDTDASEIQEELNRILSRHGLKVTTVGFDDEIAFEVEAI